MNKLGILAATALFSFSIMSCDSNASEKTSQQEESFSEVKEKTNDSKTGKVIVLTEAEFKKLVWDYDANPSKWVYEGELPAVIDFYADWCGPCKRVAPIMEKLAKEYDGRIIIYKVNTDQNRELSGVFGIRSIPSILFIPKSDQPSMQAGALQEAQYRKIFDEFVLGNKKTEKTEKK